MGHLAGLETSGNSKNEKTLDKDEGVMVGPRREDKGPMVTKCVVETKRTVKRCWRRASLSDRFFLFFFQGLVHVGLGNT